MLFFHSQGYGTKVKGQGCLMMLYCTIVCGSELLYSFSKRLALMQVKDLKSATLYSKKNYQLDPEVHGHIANLPLSLIKLIIVLIMHAESGGGVS